MAQQYYKWCHLTRDLSLGVSEHDFAWIPERYAVVDKYLNVRGQEGWRVVYVGHRLEKEKAEARERDYIHQREMSDI